MRRADTLLAIAIARLSGIRRVLLALNLSGDLDRAVMAGTMKEAMPAGIQQVWIQDGVIAEASVAA